MKGLFLTIIITNLDYFSGTDEEGGCSAAVRMRLHSRTRLRTKGQRMTKALHLSRKDCIAIFLCYFIGIFIFQVATDEEGGYSAAVRMRLQSRTRTRLKTMGKNKALHLTRLDFTAT